MKISLFAQAPYRYLPEDFEQHHESVCSVPYSLTTREGVYSSIRDFMEEGKVPPQTAASDAVAVTERGRAPRHGAQPGPGRQRASHMTEAEGIDAGSSDGPLARRKSRSRPAAEEYARST
jgi:hypothetical protein